MSVAYDEKVLVSFADRLYRRASSMVVLYAVVAGAFGAAVVGVGGALASRDQHDWAFPNVLMLLFAGFSAYLGARVGSERAFALRLMAQTALCQAQIERNTRASADALQHAVRGAEREATAGNPLLHDGLEELGNGREPRREG